MSQPNQPQPTPQFPGAQHPPAGPQPQQGTQPSPGQFATAYGQQPQQQQQPPYGQPPQQQQQPQYPAQPQAPPPQQQWAQSQAPPPPPQQPQQPQQPAPQFQQQPAQFHQQPQQPQQPQFHQQPQQPQFHQQPQQPQQPQFHQQPQQPVPQQPQQPQQPRQDGLTQTTFLGDEGEGQQPPVTEPPVQVQQESLAPPAEQQAPSTPAEQQSPPTSASAISLLKGFGKQDNCDRYTKDGERVKLLEDFLWTKAVVPTISLEEYLQGFVPLADFDDSNKKRPVDAVKELLPRSKKKAEELGVQQWSAKGVVEFLCAYIDESPGVPLASFIGDPAVKEKFLAGAYKPKDTSPPAQQQESSGVQTAPAQNQPVPEAGAGFVDGEVRQRAIYRHQDGREIRGYTTLVWTDNSTGESRRYANFVSDAQEEFPGLSILSLTPCGDPPAQTPQVDEGELTVLEEGLATVGAAEFNPASEALNSAQPVGVVPIGDNIYAWRYNFSAGVTAMVAVVNGEQKPFVDACLVYQSPDNVLAELPPRENLSGTYDFAVQAEVAGVTQPGIYRLKITGN